MKLEEIKFGLKKEFHHGLEKVFDKLDELLSPDCNVYKDYLVLKSNYDNLKKQERLGIARLDEIQVLNNKVIYSTISLIESLHRNDIQGLMLTNEEDSEEVKRSEKVIIKEIIKVDYKYSILIAIGLFLLFTGLYNLILWLINS